jgi:MFS family permease
MHPNRLQTLFLNFSHFFDHMLILIYATAVISIGIEFDKSYGEILAIATPGVLLYGSMAMPFGWIGDRKGRHCLMVFFFIGIGIGLATFLTAFSTSIWQIGIGLTFISFFAVIYHPVGIPMLIQGVKRPGRVLGANGVFGNMGVAAAPLIAGTLITACGWRGAFMALGISCMIVGILFLKLVPVDAPANFRANKSGKAFDEFMPNWQRFFIVIGTITLVAGFIFNSTTVSLPKLFQERFTETIPSTIGFTALASLVYACASFAQVAAGYAVDRFPQELFLLGYCVGKLLAYP